MSERLKSLREQRGGIGKEMQAITDKVNAEKRDLSPEELVKHGELYSKQDNLRQQIEAEERQIEVSRELASRAGDLESERRAKGGGGDGDTPESRAMAAFRGFLRTGRIEGDGAQELRQMSAGRETEGGYIIAPTLFVATLIQGMDAALWVRGSATKFQLGKAETMGAPSLDGDLDDADWTSELRTGRDDDGVKFGKRELHPQALAKRIKVSKTLLRRSVLPIEQIILQRLAYKFGVTAEKAYLLGNGNKKPLGMFVASDHGIPTSRDISTGNTNSAITFDGVIEAKYALKAQYWAKAEWIFHRDVVKALVKLKDADGNYIWRQSMKDGEPDTLLGRPLRISDFAPSAMTAGAYVGLFADLSYYWIADALDMQVQRLTELYAETNQDGFIGRLESDGMPVLAEAFSRLTLAA
jgi:HK97 family phage major capsid protein